MNSYSEHLEASLFELVSILAHESLWNTLSNAEREKVGKIIRSSQEAKEKFEKTL